MEIGIGIIVLILCALSTIFTLLYLSVKNKTDVQSKSSTNTYRILMFVFWGLLFPFTIRSYMSY